MARHHRENFPIASRLLPQKARSGVMALYGFARAADDLADDPALSPAVREKALRDVDNALREGKTQGTPPWAHGFMALCDARDGRDLLSAFIADQTITRCESWEAMLDYCRYSALPVGRSFLALCGEAQADTEALFALCACLQIVNHLQDIRDDYRVLGRIYLPGDWLREADVAEEELGATQCSDGLRQVIDRVLLAMRPLLERAHELPRSVHSIRLRAELRWVLAVLRLLHRRLGREDPLAARVAPGKAGKLHALLLAALPSPYRSSFYWPMQLAGGDKRRALRALHGFLHAVDNAADAPGADKATLVAWERECHALRKGEAHTREGRALLPYIRRFHLRIEDLEAVVQGCRMDVDGTMHRPSPAVLTAYCERVACAPGRLILAVLGQRDEAAAALAFSLGQALQRTNILRDEAEDAVWGRCYFAPSARAEFIRQTEGYYREAGALLARMRRRDLLPVRLMRRAYWRKFCLMR